MIKTCLDNDDRGLESRQSLKALTKTPAALSPWTSKTTEPVAMGFSFHRDAGLVAFEAVVTRVEADDLARQPFKLPMVWRCDVAISQSPRLNLIRVNQNGGERGNLHPAILP